MLQLHWHCTAAQNCDAMARCRLQWAPIVLHQFGAIGIRNFVVSVTAHDCYTGAGI